MEDIRTILALTKAVGTLCTKYNISSDIREDIEYELFKKYDEEVRLASRVMNEIDLLQRYGINMHTPVWLYVLPIAGLFLFSFLKRV